jgi:ribonuclease R
VAIADVSFYVRPKTAIDKDAFERGNSTYFPGWVYPMLPEILSNELCSLRPNIPRLALVAEMQIDFQGGVRDAAFYEAVIESKHRVTYGQAQEVIDGQGDAALQHVEETILRAADLAKILMNRRFKEGSLDLDVPQSEIILDEAGNPVDISRSERLFAHRLIEELMLIANVCVGEFIEQSGEPGIYRIHEEPAEDNLQALENYMRNFGGHVKGLHGGKIQKKLTSALQSFENKPEAQILNILTLRSMKQAQYDSRNVGHFGLGFKTYTHFTSPIRRYADLIVHRIVKGLLAKTDKKSKGSNQGAFLYAEEDLTSAGTQLSACEQRSVKAERQFQAIKRARFMSTKVGEEFDGVISSVTRFGVFVLLRAFDVDGLVKVEALGNDYFEFIEDTLTLRGKRTKTEYKIGDEIRIQVAGTDIELGQIDFVLPGVETGKPKRFGGPPPPRVKEREQRANFQHRKTNRKDAKKRGSSKDDRGRSRKKRVSARRRKG